MKKVAEENSFLEPYLIIVGSPDHYSQAFLIVDSRLIGEIKEIELVPLVLLASYDVFNMLSERLRCLLFYFGSHCT